MLNYCDIFSFTNREKVINILQKYNVFKVNVLLQISLNSFKSFSTFRGFMLFDKYDRLCVLKTFKQKYASCKHYILK